MTELLLQHETQLRQSRVLESQPNQKPNPHADFDTKFADFLAFASSSDLAQNGQDFQQEQNRYTPEKYREEYSADYSHTDREEFAVDYNHDQENEAYRAENYRDDDGQAGDDETSHQDRHIPENNNDDADNNTDSETATAKTQDSNQQNNSNDNALQNNGQNNSNNTAPINQELENLTQLVNNQPINNVTINQAGGHKNADNANNAQQQTVTPQTVTPQTATASLATAQTVNPQTATVAQQLATNNATNEAVNNSGQTTTQTVTPLVQAENNATTAQSAQSNQAQTTTASAKKISGQASNQPLITPTAEQVTPQANQQINQQATGQAGQTNAAANINQPQNADNSQANISVAQPSAQSTAPSGLAETADNAQIATQKAAAPTVTAQAKQPTQERSLLDELPVIAKSPLQSVIAETQNPQSDATQSANVNLSASQQATQAPAQAANSPAPQQQANVNQPTNQTGNQAANQTSAGQASAGQKSLDLPVEKITITQINGQESANAQVKNIQQPLRINGGQLLQAQENSGSQLLQDLKTRDAQGQTSPQQSGAEKSVFDARHIKQSQAQQQNGAQPILTATQPSNPQAGDRPQATQIANNNANNATHNLGQQSGQQQAFTGDGNPQSQNQPQNQSQSQNQSLAQNNQQSNSPTQADNSNSARFSQQFSETAQQVRKLHQQLSVKIQNAHSNEQTRINIQLRPAELGRVDVQIETLANGKLQLTIAPDKADTLQLLQRDASTLQQSLQDAGLNVDQKDLNFLLRQDFAEGQKGKQSGGDNNRHAAQGEEEADTPLPEQSLDEYVTVTDDGRINARV